MSSVACGNLHTFLRLSILNNFLKENVPGKRRKSFFTLFFHSSYSESQTSGIFWCYQDCMIQISQLSLGHYMCLKFKSVQGIAVFSCSSRTQQMEPEGSGVRVHSQLHVCSVSLGSMNPQKCLYRPQRFNTGYLIIFILNMFLFL